MSSAFRNAPENQGGGKGILIQKDHTGALSTLNNQMVYKYEKSDNDESETDEHGLQ